jgi:hypothetical protein
MDNLCIDGLEFPVITTKLTKCFVGPTVFEHVVGS